MVRIFLVDKNSFDSCFIDLYPRRMEECSNSVRRVARALNYEDECSYWGDSSPPRGDVNNLNGEANAEERPYFRISQWQRRVVWRRLN